MRGKTDCRDSKQREATVQISVCHQTCQETQETFLENMHSVWKMSWSHGLQTACFSIIYLFDIITLIVQLVKKTPVRDKKSLLQNKYLTHSEGTAEKINIGQHIIYVYNVKRITALEFRRDEKKQTFLSRK